MVREILINPDPRLRATASAISIDEIIAGAYSQLISDMRETMLKKDGIGLAAPQIGEPIRLVVVNTKSGVLPLFNPKITKKSWRKSVAEEGCLSVPCTFGKVKRHFSIQTKALSQKGEPLDFKASGMFARVIQHELDHLDGILFIDKAKGSAKIKNQLT